MTTTTDAAQPSKKPVATDASPFTPCDSYRMAVQLAATRRRAGSDSYAVYVVALESWCVT